jgi:hypothetical protein
MRHCGAGREAKTLRGCFLRNQDGGGAVGHLTGIARCHAPADFGKALSHRRVLEGRFQRAKLLDRRVASDAFVAFGALHGAAGTGHVQWHDAS